MSCKCVVLYGAKTPSVYNVTHISYNRLHSVVKPWDHHFLYTPVALGTCWWLKTNESEIAIETLATLSWFTEPLCATCKVCVCMCLMYMLLKDNGGDLQQRAIFNFKICDVMSVGKTWFCFDFILFKYLLIFWGFNHIFILILLLILINL